MNAFDRFISRLEMAAERISEPKEMLIETYRNVWVEVKAGHRGKFNSMECIIREEEEERSKINNISF